MLGCLVEKQLTTPQQYPLTDNALIAACNQTTSRDPVVDYDLTAVRLAVRSLRERGLVRTVHRPGERSDKHRHELEDALGLGLPAVAVLAVLLLRGPQTAAELRARTERMHPFGSVGEVEQVLDDLGAREEPLVARLPRQSGRREDRYAELLVDSAPGSGASGAPSAAGPIAADVVAAGDGGAGPSPAGPAEELLAAPVPTSAGHLAAVPPTGPSTAALAAEVAALREEVAALRAEVAALRG